MKISAGTIVTDGDYFLIGHVTHTSRFDIPKGKVEHDESPLEAAIRELKEETNLTAGPADLQDLGEISYIPGKRLHLYKWNLPSKIDAKFLSALKCNSTTSTGLYEFDYFQTILPDMAEHYLTNSMIKSLQRVNFL